MAKNIGFRKPPVPKKTAAEKRAETATPSGAAQASFCTHSFTYELHGIERCSYCGKTDVPPAAYRRL